MTITIRKDRYAFTLIELLVVVGIVALLAGLLIPVFFRIKAKARQNVCASNLHQLGMACLLYAQDNDGIFPLYVNVAPGAECRISGYIGTWQPCHPDLLHEELTPYVKNKEIWFCPSDQYAGLDVNIWHLNHLYSSYLFNFGRAGYGRGGWITDAGEWVGGYILPPDKTQICNDGNNFDEYEDEREGWPLDGDGHFHGNNTFFLDGHVKWAPIYWSHL